MVYGLSALYEEYTSPSQNAKVSICFVGNIKNFKNEYKKTKKRMSTRKKNKKCPHLSPSKMHE